MDNASKPDFNKAENYYKHIKKKLKFDKEGKWDGSLGSNFPDVEELIYLSLFPEGLDNLLQRRNFIREYHQQLLSGTFSSFKNVYDKTNQLPSKTKTYAILIFLYISNIFQKDFLFQTLKVGGIEFEYLGNRKSPSGFCVEEVTETLEWQSGGITHYDLNRKLHYIQAMTKAVDDRQAIDKVANHFELIRAAYNYSELFGSRRISSSYDDPLSQLRAPVAYSILENNKQLPAHYPLFGRFDSREKSEYKPLSNSRQALFLKLRRIIQKSSKSEIEEILVRCIEQLSEAMDAANKTIRFLNFYQVCEYATTGLSTEATGSKEVGLLAKYFNDEVTAEMVRTVIKVRNQLVHAGKFYHYSNIHVNWVQELAESSIKILLWMIDNKLQTDQEFKIFWALYSDFRNNQLGKRERHNKDEQKVIGLLKKSAT